MKTFAPNRLNTGKFIFKNFSEVLRNIHGCIAGYALLCGCLFFIGCETAGKKEVSGKFLFQDDLQRQLRLPGHPRRIVSLAPNITEILFALDADSLVVGVTDFCDYPKQAQSCTRVGSFLSPNIEAIVSLSPDVVIMTVEGNTRETFAKLEELHVPTFVTNPRAIQGVAQSFSSIGKLIDREAQAEKFIDSLSLALRETEQQPLFRKPRVIMFVSFEPLMVVGGNTFIDELITKAGGENIGAMAKGSYPVFNREEILRQNPEMILIPSDIRIPISELVQKYPEWKLLHAMQEENVFFVDAAILQRPGPRIIEALSILRGIFLTHIGH